MTGDACRRVLAACNSRARQSAVAALVGALLLAGCATGRSAQQSVGGWFDRVLEGTAAQGEPRLSYAAVARVKVYSEPDASSSVQGVLNLHEEILRYQSESGFAWVEADGSLAGWVRESQLLLQRPQARRPAAVEPEQPTAAEPAQPAEATPAPEDSAETGTSPPPSTDAPTEPVPPEPDAEPLEPERSVFDPY